MTHAEYATAMAMLAERVIRAVHDEKPDTIAAEVQQALTLTPPPDVDPVIALVTVVAASVPPGTPMRDRLAWVLDLDAEGQAA